MFIFFATQFNCTFHKNKRQTLDHIRKLPTITGTQSSGTMSSELSTNVLLARHKAYLPSHQPFPTFAELAPLGKIPHIMVVTCADPRCIPENFLGINPGEIITIRNAGGNVQMALPNILALDALVQLDEIMVRIPQSTYPSFSFCAVCLE
jgi:Carbonic anhydrase